MPFHPTPSTVVFVTVFLVVYTAYLVRNTLRNNIDLYDFAMLASVAVIPAMFVYFPDLVVRITRFVGVEFPFLLLFGALSLIVFLYLYRLVIKTNEEWQTIILLTQEIGILREALDRELRHRRSATVRSEEVVDFRKGVDLRRPENELVGRGAKETSAEDEVFPAPE